MVLANSESKGERRQEMERELNGMILANEGKI
jgi:hypothetical protein